MVMVGSRRKGNSSWEQNIIKVVAAGDRQTRGKFSTHTNIFL